MIIAINNSKYHVSPNIIIAMKNAPLISDPIPQLPPLLELSPSRISMIPNVRNDKVVNPNLLKRFFVFNFNAAIFTILVESGGRIF